MNNYTQKQWPITPWYVTGLTDADGMFAVSVSTRVMGEYKVTAHATNRGVLLGLQQFFGCGRVNIDNRQDNTLKFVVSSQHDLQTKIIPHFQQYPLQGSKMLNFLDFIKAVEMLSKGVHLTPKGRAEVVLVIANMNKSRSFADKYNYLTTNTPVVNADYVRGFIDGEGHFAVEVNKPQAGRKYHTIACSLQIGQASHDVLLLSAFLQFFGGSRLKPSYDYNSLEATQSARALTRLWVTQPITKSRLGVNWDNSPIIRLINVSPLLTYKQLDYQDWLRIVTLAASQAHHSPEGLAQIASIKEGMNQGREKINIDSLSEC